MTQTIVNLGSAGSVLNGQNGSTASADSNDAEFLDWPGHNAGSYIYVATSSNNGMSVPDQAALDITGDIDIRAYVALDDWTPSAVRDVVAKYNTSGDQRGYMLRVNTSGGLSLVWSETGTAATVRTASSTAALTVSDRQPLWIRATLDVDNGASGCDAKFYTSSDGTTWTQLGATVTQATITTIYANTATAQFGVSGQAPEGKYYRAQVLNGIGGTTVLDIDASVISSGSAISFTAVTGQTVTINRATSGRKSVAVVSPVWLFGTDDYMEVPHNALVDFSGTDSFTAFLAIRTWSTPTNYMRYLEKGAALGTGYSIQSHATTLGFFFGVRNSSTWYLQDGFAYSSGTLQTVAMRIDHATNLMTNYRNASAATPVAIPAVWSLNNGEPLRIASRSGAPGQYGEFELLALAIFRRALTATEISTLDTYYKARLS